MADGYSSFHSKSLRTFRNQFHCKSSQCTGFMAVSYTHLMEEREQFQDSIESEGLRMSRLVDDMLSLANADNQSWSIHPTLLEPETLVLDVYENFERIAHKKGISLTVNLPDIPMSKINADKERMIQVLTILLDNALYHTPQGGRITLLSLIHI